MVVHQIQCPTHLHLKTSLPRQLPLGSQTDHHGLRVVFVFVPLRSHDRALPYHPYTPQASGYKESWDKGLASPRAARQRSDQGGPAGERRSNLRSRNESKSAADLPFRYCRSSLGQIYFYDQSDRRRTAVLRMILTCRCNCYVFDRAERFPINFLPINDVYSILFGHCMLK